MRTWFLIMALLATFLSVFVESMRWERRQPFDGWSTTARWFAVGVLWYGALFAEV